MVAGEVFFFGVEPVWKIDFAKSRDALLGCGNVDVDSSQLVLSLVSLGRMEVFESFATGIVTVGCEEKETSASDAEKERQDSGKPEQRLEDGRRRGFVQQI